MTNIPQKYNVVMLSMSNMREWTDMGFANRNLHIFNQLRNRPDVDKILHIDYLPYNLKRTALSFFRNISKYNGDVISKTITSKLCRLEKNVYQYSTIDSFLSSKRAVRGINKILSELGFKNTILWSYLPIHPDIYSNIDSDLKIFDAVDNWAEHPGYQSIQDEILSNYKKIDEIADIIFTVSEDLKNLFPNNKNVHWIPNGVDIDHFKNPINNSNSGLKDLAKGQKIVGYAGIIQKRFDVELVKSIIEKNSDKYFVFIGIVWPDAGVDVLKKYNNVNFIGHKQYQELPGYLSQFDVAIIPHKIDEFTKSMNPLKVYEYLAMEKPIVSTDVAGVREFGDSVSVAASLDEFSCKINEAIDQDSPEKIIKRRDIAKDHSWLKRVDEMFNKINSRQ